MPPPYVKTIRDELYYEYAKLISRSALGKINYGFIGDRFKELRANHITISGTIREWEQEQRLPKQCVFCGATRSLEKDHLVPQSRRGSNSADNMVWSCKTCNTSRRNRRIFEWLGLEKKDQLRRLVAGKYLKLLLNMHEIAGTLDTHKKEIERLCGICGLGKTCLEWETVQKLSCFCLESIIP
jgi:hypothetical protein